MTASPIRLDQSLELGLAAHQANRLHEAEAHYRAILAQDPAHADALHLLGVVAHQSGQAAIAIELIARARSLRADPNFANSLGEALRAAGRISEALAVYETALAAQPGHIAARGNRAITLAQLGQFADAVPALRDAIDAAPVWTDLRRHLGESLLRLGAIDPAVTALEEALIQAPADAMLLHRSATALAAWGRDDLAVARLRAAIEHHPTDAQWHYDLGGLLRRLNRIPEATQAYQRAVDLKPDFADALMNWGNALQEAGALEAALACYERGLTALPGSAAIRTNLCQLLLRMERVDDAILVGEAAVAVEPTLVEAQLNLGNAYHGRNRVEDAVACYRAALAVAPGRLDIRCNLASALAALDADAEAFALFDAIEAEAPTMAELFVNRGKAFAERRMVARAEADYRRAVALAPDLAVAHANLGVTRLLRGDFAEGWHEFEWRWRTPGFAKLAEGFTAPVWDGSDLAGRTILLHNEQGFGDTLQFCRFAGILQARGARVLLQVQRPLARLMADFALADQVIAEGDPLPPHDLRCPLMSVPHRLGTDLASIPADVPYLRADPAAVRVWAERLAVHGPGVRVGLIWAASPDNPVDRRRTVNLAPMAPLGAVQGVRFFALQKGEAAAQATTRPTTFTDNFTSLSDSIEDFADTAAIIANLDLVISVCSSPAHLAAAMGKPVWVIDRFDGDWRWLLERDDTPWYPNLRLFRQPARGDWQTPVARIVDALRHRIG